MSEEIAVLSLSDFENLLTDDEKIYFDKYRNKFNEYLEKIKNYSLMDLDVEYKRCINKRNQLNDAISNIKNHIKIDEMVMETDLMFKGHTLEDISENPMLYVSKTPENCMEITKKKNLMDEVTEKMLMVGVNAKICDQYRNIKYSGVEMNDIEKLVAKLENDIKMLQSSSDGNKDIKIANIEKAIELIRELPEKFLHDTIPTDKRAKKILKEYDPKLISRILGPTVAVDFLAKLSHDLSKIHKECNINAALLFLYHISKKIENSMKSMDYKSLVYKSYIVKYMIIVESDSEESIKLSTIFNNVMQGYIDNGVLSKTGKLLAYN